MMIFMISPAVAVSRLPVGSSAIRIEGLLTRALAGSLLFSAGQLAGKGVGFGGRPTVKNRRYLTADLLWKLP